MRTTPPSAFGPPTPADTSTIEPTPRPVLPTSREIGPAPAPDDDPLEIRIEPAFADAVLEDINTFPDDPAIATPLSSDTAPLLPVVETPDEMRTVPDEPVSAAPLDRVRLPLEPVVVAPV